VLNLDKTAINWSIEPQHVYAPSNSERGAQEQSDVKARFTAVPTVNADGGFLTTMYILKHSKASKDKPQNLC
jgi:hypothetical protein